MGKLWMTAATILLAGSMAMADMPIGSNFWAIGWHNPKDVFAEGRDNVKGEDPWNPQFLKEIDAYTCLRFMDWDKANKAEWDYSRELAELIKAQLDPNLKVYVEYSNETWNGMFKQFHYCVEQGEKLKLPGQDMKPGENKYYAGWAYHVYAALRHHENFEKVFSGEDRARLGTVLAGQSGNPAVATHHAAVLKDKTVNPKGIQPDCYSIAPYFGGKIKGTASDVFDQLRKDIRERVVPKVKAHADIAHGAGMKLIAYEGGQHVLDQAVIPNRKQEMYDVYLEYLDAMDDHMDGVFAHYVHVGTGPPRNMWGAMDHTGQDPAEAPKYRALMKYIAQSNKD